MKIKYNQLKGYRIKKGTFKLSNSNRENIFRWLECNDTLMWWNYDKKKWLPLSECQGNRFSSCNDTIHSLKSAIKHMDKQSVYLPKGMKFTLGGRLMGYDIEITT